MKLLVTLLLLASLLATTTMAGLTREPRRVGTSAYQHHNSAVQRPGANKYSGASGKNAYSSAGGGKEQILRNDQVMMKDGAYRYDYETSNGIAGAEQGVGGVSVQGSSSYISPEGVEVKMSYTADETGYHPVGDHIPQIPDYIVRALEYIRTHPYVEKNQYGGGGGGGSAGKSASKFRAPPKISTSIAPPHRSAPIGRAGGAFKKSNTKNFGRQVG